MLKINSNIEWPSEMQDKPQQLFNDNFKNQVKMLKSAHKSCISEMENSQSSSITGKL